MPTLPHMFSHGSKSPRVRIEVISMLRFSLRRLAYPYHTPHISSSPLISTIPPHPVPLHTTAQSRPQLQYALGPSPSWTPSPITTWPYAANAHIRSRGSAGCWIVGELGAKSRSSFQKICDPRGKMCSRFQHLCGAPRACAPNAAGLGERLGRGVEVRWAALAGAHHALQGLQRQQRRATRGGKSAPQSTAASVATGSGKVEVCTARSRRTNAPRSAMRFRVTRSLGLLGHDPVRVARTR